MATVTIPQDEYDDFKRIGALLKQKGEVDAIKILGAAVAKNNELIIEELREHRKIIADLIAAVGKQPEAIVIPAPVVTVEAAKAVTVPPAQVSVNVPEAKAEGKRKFHMKVKRDNMGLATDYDGEIG